MDYKKMMGYGDKKKVNKKESKPKTNKILEEVKKELNEWSYQPPSTKRWSGASDKGLTEFEKQGGKDNINEGPAAEYNKAYTNVKKTYGLFWDAVHDFQSLLIKKGLRRHAKDLDRQYSGVEKFYKFFFKMMDKLQ